MKKQLLLPRCDDVQLDHAQSGYGQLRSACGCLPLTRLEYRTQVLGLSSATTLTQTFCNPYDQCIEATYVFPLPGMHAVTDCVIRVGDRIIRADLKERGQARADYNRAIRRGYRAAIAEEQRSETFSLRVGNIPPGEQIDVLLTVVGELSIAGDEATLRLPLVVAPRYVAGTPLDGSSVGTGTHVDTDAVPDASCITPPVMLPGCENPVELSIEVAIDPAGLISHEQLLGSLRSSLHAVLVSDGTPCFVRLQPGEAINRDFILRFSVCGSSIRAGLAYAQGTAETAGTFAMHVIAPPATNGRKIPRDVVLVLDRSGSMSGWKIAAARRGLGRILESLDARDRFQIIAFDDRVESPADLSSGWIDATDRNRWKAIEWLAKIVDRGGTEMGPALHKAMQLFAQQTPAANSGRSPAIVLVTDGQVAGEDHVLRTISSLPPTYRPRLFCLGIDRAVNASVLQRLADQTNGTCELVESERRLDEILQRFCDEIGVPALSNVRLESIGVEMQANSLSPGNRTELYAGRPLTIYGRITGAAHKFSLRVSGILANGDVWEQTHAAAAAPSAALLPLWGRHRVRELEDRYAVAGRQDMDLQQQIIDTSLESHVLSRFTAYVAVDDTEVVNRSESLHRVVQPVELPEGWQWPTAPAFARRPMNRPLVPLPDIAQWSIDETILEIVPESVARENSVFPVRWDGETLVVKAHDVNDIDTIEKLRFILNQNIRAEFAPRDAIHSAINQYYGVFEGDSADSLLQDFTDSCIDQDVAMAALQIDTYDQVLQEFTDTAIDYSESEICERTGDDIVDASLVPIILLATELIKEARQLRVTHIYIRPLEDRFEIFYVIDGEQHQRDTMKLRFLSALIARLKVFCNVDFEQRDELQHGTWRTTFGGSELAWSSYFVPTDAGCAVIMWSENLSARLYAEANRPPIVDEWLAAAQKYIEANPSPTAEAIFRRLQSES